MDAFIMEWTMFNLQRQIDANRLAADQHFTMLDDEVADIKDRLTFLENSSNSVDTSINNLRTDIANLQKLVSQLTNELNKTKLVNLKQEIIIRTMHNMNVFKADDMYVDTFANGDNIDFIHSIRAEWMEDHQAIGKTRGSTIIVQQALTPSALFISKNGVSDEAIAQSFLSDQSRRIDKISLYVGKYNASTNRPLTVALRDQPNGADLTSADINLADTNMTWVDVDLPDYTMNADQLYYIVVYSEDTYGYKIGIDPQDRYLGGSSFSLYQGNWMDNGFDIAFKVWAFPSDAENNATILTNPVIYDTTPLTMIFEKQDMMIDGSIVYYVSRDGGGTWKVLQPGIVTDLNDLPPGKSIVLKAYVTGESRVEAWGYVITRGDT